MCIILRKAIFENLFVVEVFKRIRTSSELEIELNLGLNFFLHHSAPLFTAAYQPERQICCT